MTAVMYVMTAGAAAMRRLQGGGAMQAGMPGSGPGVAAASGGSSMFAAKEYSKVCACVVCVCVCGLFWTYC